MQQNSSLESLMCPQNDISVTKLICQCIDGTVSTVPSNGANPQHSDAVSKLDSGQGYTPICHRAAGEKVNRSQGRIAMLISAYILVYAIE